MANVTYRRPKNLDRNGMILRIQNRKATGQSLRFCDVCPENRDYAFAIRREFRSGANAVEAAESSDSES